MGLNLGGFGTILGGGLGALLALPTGGMSVGMGALLGGMGGASLDAYSAQQEANKTNVDLTRETNEASIELANTAHQREIADLKKAGLNPILSAKYGGATTPSLQNPSIASLAPVIHNSAQGFSNAAMSTQNLAADIAVKKSQVSVNSASAVKAGAEAQRVMMENDVLAMDSELRKREASHKLNRPRGSNEAGWDIGDGIRTIGKFLH